MIETGTGREAHEMPRTKSVTNPIGALLRERLDDVGMSAPQLADAAHVSRATVYRWLDPDRPFRPAADSADLLPLLASALQMDASVLASLWRGDVDVVPAVDDKDRAFMEFRARCRDVGYVDVVESLAVADAFLRLRAQSRTGIADELRDAVKDVDDAIERIEAATSRLRR